MLLIATTDGVYRAKGHPPTPTEVVLGIPTRTLHVSESGGRVYAATERGLLESPDDGDSWRSLGLFEAEVYSVLVDGEDLYAGVRPAGLYHSPNGGVSWTRLTSFDDAPGADSWPTNPHRDDAWVRTLATATDATDLLVAGVEVGGVVYSEDAGGTWNACPAVPDDVHQVVCRSETEWVVSCGTGGPRGVGGVFRTTDGGGSWDRLDTGDRPYVRASCHAGRLYTAANRVAPLWEPPDAALLVESDDGTLEAVPYPNEPTSFVLSWAEASDGLLAGTNDGRILYGSGDDWQEVGSVPVSAEDRRFSGIRSLVAY